MDAWSCFKINAMSNRTWACIDCGKTYRRNQNVASVRCAICSNFCEYVHWKIRVPSPKNRKTWEKFWLRYKAEKRLLAEYHASGRRMSVHLEILNLDLPAMERDSQGRFKKCVC